MSPQQKRSTQYDWFKGGTPNSVQKTPKEKAKTIWKFVKILLYTALFGFSMTGCIQTFVIKTQTQVGRGVEFFSNADEVSPHTTTFQGTKTGTAGAKSLYKFESVDGNFWLNKASGTAKDLGSLAAAHQTITQDQKVSMDDAYKETNEGLRLMPVGATTDRAGKLAVADGTRTIVISSKAQGYKTGATISKDVFHGMYVVNDGSTAAANPFVQVTGDLLTLDGQTAFTGLTDAKLKARYKAYESYTFDAINVILNYDLGNGVRLGDWLKEQGTGLSADDTKALRVAQTNAFKNILDYLKLGLRNDKDITAGFKIIPGSIPAVGTDLSSDWRPFVTWANAWKAGPFYGIFVYPVAYIAANMINAMPFMSGWETLISIFIVVFLMRAITFALSFKATMQQTKMQELTGKKAIIDAKYAAYKGNKQMENRQKQEVSEMYKKEGVSMFGSLSSIFLTMPFFLAIWRTIGALPHIKSTVWLGINFSATSWKELFAGHFEYLPLMVIAALFAGFQQLFPRLLTKRRDKNRINVHQKAAMKKSNKTQNIMMLVFVFMALIFSAGLQVYWIAGGMWMTIQSYATHRLFIRQSKNKKRRKIKV